MGANIFGGFYTVYFDLNFMNVSVESTFGSSVRMAYIVAAHSALTAYNANSTHNYTSKNQLPKEYTINRHKYATKKRGKNKKIIFFCLARSNP